MTAGWNALPSRVCWRSTPDHRHTCRRHTWKRPSTGGVVSRRTTSRMTSRRTGRVFLESRGEGVRGILEASEEHADRRSEYRALRRRTAPDDLGETLASRGKGRRPLTQSTRSTERRDAVPRVRKCSATSSGTAVIEVRRDEADPRGPIGLGVSTLDRAVRLGADQPVERRHQGQQPTHHGEHAPRQARLKLCESGVQVVPGHDVRAADRAANRLRHRLGLL